MNLRIRPATETDVPLILSLIRELADYEKLLDQVAATETSLRTALFGARPAAEAILAEIDGQPAGFALFVQNFSTFLGQAGLYLEDLYVRPLFRRQGIGQAMLAALARIAIERGYGRMEWSVLNWNETAIRVYRRVGARPLDEWTVYRLTGEDLRRLAGA